MPPRRAALTEWTRRCPRGFSSTKGPPPRVADELTVQCAGRHRGGERPACDLAAASPAGQGPSVGPQADPCQWPVDWAGCVVLASTAVRPGRGRGPAWRAPHFGAISDPPPPPTSRPPDHRAARRRERLWRPSRTPGATGRGCFKFSFPAGDLPAQPPLRRKRHLVQKFLGLAYLLWLLGSH